MSVSVLWVQRPCRFRGQVCGCKSVFAAASEYFAAKRESFWQLGKINLAATDRIDRPSSLWSEIFAELKKEKKSGLEILNATHPYFRHSLLQI